MHAPTDPHPTESLVRALVLLHRYSRDITEIAFQSLGRDATENRDIQVLMALHRCGPLTPTMLGRHTAAPRSSVSRAVNRLESVGLIARGTDPSDARSVRISLTPKGRRRMSVWSARMGDYFRAGEPLVKESFSVLHERLPSSSSGPADPLLVLEGMSRAGAAYTDDVRQVMEAYGVAEERAERFTLVLLRMCGVQRPTQLADELRLTPSGTSGVLARLELAGLVTRRHDLTPGDRRAVVVALTPRGEQAVDDMLDVFARHLPTITEALAATWHLES